MFKRPRFMRPLVKRFVISALSLVVASVATAQSVPEMRMTPAEIQASALDSNQIGVPASLGFIRRSSLAILQKWASTRSCCLYQLTPRSRHTHIATIGWQLSSRASGTWATALMSVYSEPGGDNHFAQTDADSVIVEISGYGPTDTHHFEAKNDPKSGQSK
jgi:hypothetical protein